LVEGTGQAGEGVEPASDIGTDFLVDSIKRVAAVEPKVVGAQTAVRWRALLNSSAVLALIAANASSVIRV